MVQNELLVGFESALSYWRAARVADSNQLYYASMQYGAQLLDIREQATAALRECLAREPLDVVVASADQRHHCGIIRDHIWSGVATSDDMVAIGNFSEVCKLPLVFTQLGMELDEIDLALVAHELVGTYALLPWAATGSKSGIDQAETIESLSAYASAARSQGVPGAARALDALAITTEGSNSPLETKIAVLLTLSRRKGGFGLPGFQMNKRVRLSEEGQAIMGRETIRPDFVWLKQGLVLEYDSDLWHLNPESHERDSRRRAAFLASGYTPVDLTRGMLRDHEALCATMHDLERRLGYRRQPLSLSMEFRRDELLDRVLGRGASNWDFLYED